MTGTDDEAWKQLFLQQPLGLYQPLRLRGGGAFGLVYEAMHLERNLTVALKVLPPTADALTALEFEDEGRILQRLEKSSHVVDTHESGQEQLEVVVAPSGLRVPLMVKYHVLDLASGSLDELLEVESLRNGITWPERLALWRDVVKGVHQMHLASCVHRDLKSSNVLLFELPFNRTKCRLGDMGKARDLRQQARLDPLDYLTARGDLRYAPPECIYLQASDDAQAFRYQDLYGLGSLLFELCTGQGVTSVALGHGPSIFQESLADYRAGRRRDLSGLRSHYNKAFAVAEPELPPVIRDRAMSLLAQLCSPVPYERLPRTSTGRRRGFEPGLTWLFHQIDIMRKSLLIPHQRNGRTGERRIVR